MKCLRVYLFTYLSDKWTKAGAHDSTIDVNIYLNCALCNGHVWVNRPIAMSTIGTSTGITIPFLIRFGVDSAMTASCMNRNNIPCAFFPSHWMEKINTFASFTTDVRYKFIFVTFVCLFTEHLVFCNKKGHFRPIHCECIEFPLCLVVRLSLQTTHD